MNNPGLFLLPKGNILSRTGPWDILSCAYSEGFQQLFGAEGYEVVAINDLTSAKMLAHLLKYDTPYSHHPARMAERAPKKELRVRTLSR